MTERGYRVDIDKAELLKRRFQEKKLTADKIADILARKGNGQKGFYQKSCGETATGPR